MARRMADDYQETFRARVEWRRKKRDPKVIGRWVPDPDAPVHVSYYGPYDTAGTARGSGRAAVKDWVTDVVRVTVERAETTWVEVAP